MSAAVWLLCCICAAHDLVARFLFFDRWAQEAIKCVHRSSALNPVNATMEDLTALHVEYPPHNCVFVAHCLVYGLSTALLSRCT